MPVNTTMQGPPKKCRWLCSTVVDFDWHQTKFYKEVQSRTKKYILHKVKLVKKSYKVEQGWTKSTNKCDQPSSTVVDAEQCWTKTNKVVQSRRRSKKLKQCRTKVKQGRTKSRGDLMYNNYYIYYLIKGVFILLTRGYGFMVGVPTPFWHVKNCTFAYDMKLTLYR